MVEGPELRWVVPVGWSVKESVTLLAPDGQANVIFSSEPLPESVDLKTYAGSQLEVLEKEFPQFELLLTDEETELPGLGPAIRRGFTWTPTSGAPVTQVQLYAVRVGRGYTATATTPTSAFGELESLLTAALASLSVQRIDATALGLASGDGFGALPLTSTEGSGG